MPYLIGHVKQGGSGSRMEFAFQKATVVVLGTIDMRVCVCVRAHVSVCLYLCGTFALNAQNPERMGLGAEQMQVEQMGGSCNSPHEKWLGLGGWGTVGVVAGRWTAVRGF